MEVTRLSDAKRNTVVRLNGRVLMFRAGQEDRDVILAALQAFEGEDVASVLRSEIARLRGQLEQLERLERELREGGQDDGK